VKKVVDRNFLQSPRLREFFAARRKNIAVITDYAAMEAFKGDALANISQAAAILCEFPKQVAVLKSTSIVSQLKGRRCGFTRRMIDWDQSDNFGDWCGALEQAKAGNKDLLRQLLENGKEADATLEVIKDAQSDYAENLEAHAERFTVAELKALRSNAPFPEGMFEKVSQHILELAAVLFAEQPGFKGLLPTAQELPYTFIFRYAVAGYILALRWIAVGGAKKVKPENIRNDMVDATFAAYATYFQGLLTDDAKANEIFAETKRLVNVFLSVPPLPDHAMKKMAAAKASVAMATAGRA
jgi:hypothetical protein